jgi:Flp pilus assembly pilin Flp
MRIKDMRSATCFLQDEDGAVTVDYVVLTAAAAGVALATLAVLSTEVRSWFRATEALAVDQGIVSGTWAAAMRDYQAYNPLLHQALVEDFSVLSDEELDTVESFVNDYIEQMTPLAENESDTGLLTDLTFAVGYAYMERVRERPYGSEPDPAEMGRLAAKMGWDGSLSGMFGDSGV